MKAQIIHNPFAGISHRRHTNGTAEQAAALLRAQGWDVEVCPTDGPGAAQRLAHEAVLAETDVVIAVGGDGTINEIIQALAGTHTALGVLPTGTINVWAREVGIPINTQQAVQVLLQGQRRRIDLGVANGRYFLLMASIGLDAEVTRAVEGHPIKRWGILAYGWITLKLSLNYWGTRVRLRLNGRRLRTRALMMIIGNTRLYAGAFHFTSEAACDDGLLDICIIRRQGYLGRLRVVLNAFLHHPRLGPRVTCERFDHLTIDSLHPIAIQLDGEPAGSTPLECSVAPNMLDVIVPTILPDGLFSKKEVLQGVRS